MDIKLYNTLTREKELFAPNDPQNVGFYSCGPTVYNFAHIGNLRSYVFADTLKRTLQYFGYKVNHVMNITDIGHLTSDADDGEDKMMKGLRREGKDITLESMKELAVFYKDRFMEDLSSLNIIYPNEVPFASDNITEEAELVSKLLEKGFAYQTPDTIYFDVSKFPDYWNLSGHKPETENTEARVEKDPYKKNPFDFALWKFGGGLGFESKLGVGFPGWHIECSAMAMKYLGEQIDIHTGGIDHIPVHHTNEIAQSECASGKTPFVKIWMHHEHINLSGEKMAKSGDNFVTLRTLIEKDINPISYRLWLLMGNYRTKMNFSFESIFGTQTALEKLYNFFLDLGLENGKIDELYISKFKELIADDLNTPSVVALMWELVKDESVSADSKKSTLLEFDKVLGLGLSSLKIDTIPEEVLNLVGLREEARQNKDFDKSDELRSGILSLGYEVKDTSSGPKVTRL